MEPRHPPENGKSPDIGEQRFNDLVYSLETKTFIRFRKQLVANNVFNALQEWKDPLPQFSFEEICEEVKKRMATLSRHKLQDTKIWLLDPWKRLIQIVKNERKRLGESASEMKRDELLAKEKEVEELVRDITNHQNKLGELISTAEKIEGEREPRTNIQKSTKKQVKQLHLFENNDDANTR